MDLVFSFVFTAEEDWDTSGAKEGSEVPGKGTNGGKEDGCIYE